MYKGFKHNNIVIIGSGSTIKKYEHQIKDLIKIKKCQTIGINNITSFLCPDYHLWTNKQRYLEFNDCISDKSILLIGSSLANKVSIKRSYLTVDYKDNQQHYDIQESNIVGNFRTAGTLAIAIAHLMEAANIYIVGMDGYTMYSEKDLNNKKVSQHFYGKGITDDVNYKKCLSKDRQIQKCLDGISKLINFKIITPTIYKNHFENILNLNL